MKAAPIPVGVTFVGLGVHALGTAVVPVVQLNATELPYAFTAISLPLKIAVCVGNTVSVGVAIAI